MHYLVDNTYFETLERVVDERQDDVFNKHERGLDCTQKDEGRLKRTYKNTSTYTEEEWYRGITISVYVRDQMDILLFLTSGIKEDHRKSWLDQAATPSY